MPKSVTGIDVVNKNLERATQEMLAKVVLAVDLTVNDAIIHARSNHAPGAHAMQRFQSRFTHLVPSILPNKTVVIPGVLVEGSYTANMEYGIFVEKGTKPGMRKGRGGKSYFHPGTAAYPYMWPAAMSVAVRFKQRVKEALTPGGK